MSEDFLNRCFNPVKGLLIRVNRGKTLVSFFKSYINVINICVIGKRTRTVDTAGN